MSAEQPQTAPGDGITSNEFLESSIDWAIAHLGEARWWLKAGDEAQFHAAIRKLDACTNALLDTLPEVRS
jgi:hypothetical protein